MEQREDFLGKEGARSGDVQARKLRGGAHSVSGRYELGALVASAGTKKAQLVALLTK